MTTKQNPMASLCLALSDAAKRVAETMQEAERPDFHRVNEAERPDFHNARKTDPIKQVTDVMRRVGVIR